MSDFSASRRHSVRSLGSTTLSSPTPLLGGSGDLVSRYLSGVIGTLKGTLIGVMILISP